VFISSLAVLQLGMVAARHHHVGGLTTNEIWLIVLVIAVIIAFFAGFSKGLPGDARLTPEQEAELQQQNFAYLNHRLLSLKDHNDYRRICAWMAERGLSYQEPLKEAYINVCNPEADVNQDMEDEV
jgi:hypothetical protein